MELMALLGKDDGSWAQISGLMKHGDWDKIVVVGDDEARNFVSEKKFDFVKIDFSKKIVELKEEFEKKLKGKFDGMEVACSVASGDGKEHMALISALINLPVGVRFVALTKDGIVYL